jgi:hypothetical protein
MHEPWNSPRIVTSMTSRMPSSRKSLTCRIDVTFDVTFE